MNLKEIGRGVVVWIHPPQDTVQWMAFFNIGMILQVP